MDRSRVPLRCVCGAVTGVAALRGDGMRLVCMCQGCQAYPRFLGREAQMLDRHGGTDIYQLTPSEMTIESGREHLRAVRQTPQGAVRWYTACCRTPVGNTLGSPRWAFVGVPALFMDHEAHGLSRDALFGPPLYKIHARYAKNPPVEGGHPSGPLSLVLRALFRIGGQSLAGRGRPTPFFDEAGRPVAPVEVLSAAQRAELGLRP